MDAVVKKVRRKFQEGLSPQGCIEAGIWYWVPFGIVSHPSWLTKDFTKIFDVSVTEVAKFEETVDALYVSEVSSGLVTEA